MRSRTAPLAVTQLWRHETQSCPAINGGVDCSTALRPKHTALRPTKHLYHNPVARHSNSCSSETLMHWRTVARMWVVSSKIRIGADMSRRLRGGQQGEGVGCWVLGGEARLGVAAFSAKTHKGHQTCGSYLLAWHCSCVCCFCVICCSLAGLDTILWWAGP